MNTAILVDLLHDYSLCTVILQAYLVADSHFIVLHGGFKSDAPHSALAGVGLHRDEVTLLLVGLVLIRSRTMSHQLALHDLRVPFCRGLDRRRCRRFRKRLSTPLAILTAVAVAVSSS